MVRFLHTSDWQLGMSRYFLAGEAQHRFSGARIDAIRTICRTAVEHHCSFIVVAGDVFESNHVDRQTAVRALDAMRAGGLPIYLLPGNHDPLDAASVYTSPTFLGQVPANVVVLDGTIVEAASGVDLVPAPWTTKRPLDDPLAGAYGVAPAANRFRIVVGHGSMDYMPRGEKDAPPIALATVEALVEREVVHYVALGDRHSRTVVGKSGRIHYSGAPEPTDFDEVDPGYALIVELEQDGVEVTPVRIGTWRFERRAFDVSGEGGLASVREWLEDFSDKERTIARLVLQGALSLDARAELEHVLARAADVFASCEVDGSLEDLLVLEDDRPFEALGLTGFAARTLAELRQTAAGDGPHGEAARDALVLLYRLARDAA